MDADVLAEAVALTRARRAFALATVVWRRAPSSGQVGSKAIVFPDGTLHGWLGGACAEPTLVREAGAALADGRSRLLFLGPSDEVERHRRDGVLAIPMACESEGALEVHIEPFLPAPQIVIVGRSPAVHALAAHAHALKWDVAVVDDGGNAQEHPLPALVRTSLDFSDLDIGPSTAIVIATQGHYDDLAVERALETNASYIGVVAAEKRAAALLQALRDRGVADDQLARVHAPAGLDLGPITNAEIAVAVLADLVARRAAGKLGRIESDPAPLTTRDPVCGMMVDIDTTHYSSEYAGDRYWFCAAACQRQFDERPREYVAH